MNSLKELISVSISENDMPPYIYTYPAKRAYIPFIDWKKACDSWRPVIGQLALYLHIPFCEMKCSFCDLFTVTKQPQNIFDRYVKAIIREIEIMEPFLQTDKLTVNSIYFGGGTPSLLSYEQLSCILAKIRTTFTIDPRAEISVEGAPNSFTREKFLWMKSLGINRISIGIQSFDGQELRTMGRNYDPELGVETTLTAIASGISNVNTDLIYGIPGQDFTKWKSNLLTAVNLGPTTITTYPLAVRKGTAYGRQMSKGIRQDFIEPISSYQWYDFTNDQLQQHGYLQHTLVTYAKDGGGCKHEANEFIGVPTLSFGAGSRKYSPTFHYVDEDYNNRLANKTTMLEYMEAIERDEILVKSGVQLTRKDQILRYFILGTLAAGVNKRRYFERFQEQIEKRFQEIIEAFVEEGYLEQKDELIKLTDKGKRFSSHVGNFIAKYFNDNKKWFEKETFGAFWEKGYRNENVSSMGGPSFEVAEILPYLPKGAKVLDLGCGEGRNSFFLAQNGCDVTAVDRSSAGINKLLQIAERYQIDIKGVVQDIVDFPLEGEYDLIMAHGVLYYLDNPVWRKLLEKVKYHTRQGGYNIFTLFVYNEQYPCVEEIEAAQYKHSFKPKELQEFYQDWQELRYDQYVKWDSHPGIPLHYHPIEKLVSQKPAHSLKRRLKKERIDVGPNMSESDFHDIQIGISQNELIEIIGKPHFIEKMHIDGPQYASGQNSGPIVYGYRFELWYYGIYVFYVINEEVAGKALYTSQPVRLVCNDLIQNF